jgi:hypothetical protein
LAAESKGLPDPAAVNILEQVLVGKMQLQAKVVLMCCGTGDTDTGIPLDLRDRFDVYAPRHALGVVPRHQKVLVKYLSGIEVWDLRAAYFERHGRWTVED